MGYYTSIRSTSPEASLGAPLRFIKLATSKKNVLAPNVVPIKSERSGGLEGTRTPNPLTASQVL